MLYVLRRARRLSGYCAHPCSRTYDTWRHDPVACTPPHAVNVRHEVLQERPEAIFRLCCRDLARKLCSRRVASLYSASRGTWEAVAVSCPTATIHCVLLCMVPQYVCPLVYLRKLDNIYGCLSRCAITIYFCRRIPNRHATFTSHVVSFFFQKLHSKHRHIRTGGRDNPSYPMPWLILNRVVFGVRTPSAGIGN